MHHAKCTPNNCVCAAMEAERRRKLTGATLDAYKIIKADLEADAENIEPEAYSTVCDVLQTRVWELENIWYSAPIENNV